MPSRAPDEIDPDWHKYPDTVLRFRTEPPVHVDLREPLTKSTLDELRDVGFSGPFAVLTAHDPRGRDEARAVNDRRAAALDARLASLRAPFVHVDACSPDGGHCEDSVAAVIPRDVATKLAREFEQVAIFWFDGENVWIVGAIVDADPVMLPRPA